MARPSRSRNQPKPLISPRERQDLETALADLPTGPASVNDDFSRADGLLKFGYHQNPYMRMFTKILWSGYALSRGQVVECDQRFKQAHRDAQMSNIDKITIRNLDEAAAALQRSMEPSGSVSDFLTEMRERTLQRIWARVCETSHLPPPSFSQIFGTGGAMTLAEMEAADAKEIAALMRDDDDSDDGDDDDDDGDDDGDDGGDDDGDDDGGHDSGDDGDGDDHGDDSGDDGDGDDGDGDDGDGDDGEPGRERESSRERDQAGGDSQAPAAFEIEVSRTGGAEAAPELLLAAASEALRTLRGRAAQGELKLIVRIVGEGKARSGRRRGRRRR